MHYLQTFDMDVERKSGCKGSTTKIKENMRFLQALLGDHDFEFKDTPFHPYKKKDQPMESNKIRSSDETSGSPQKLGPGGGKSPFYYPLSSGLTFDKTKPTN